MARQASPQVEDLFPHSFPVDWDTFPVLLDSLRAIAKGQVTPVLEAANNGWRTLEFVLYAYRSWRAGDSHAVDQVLRVTPEPVKTLFVNFTRPRG